MRRYPQSNGRSTPNIVTDRFIGVSRKAIAPEGSFADCENVSSDNYPGICSSAGYADVAKPEAIKNIQAMMKPSDGEGTFCGVADGTVYWMGAELEYAPKSNFTVQADSKIVLYMHNKYLYIYEMRKSGFCVLYEYDTANRKSLENNYVKVCYQRYGETAGNGLCLCLRPGNISSNAVKYPDSVDYVVDGNRKNQRTWVLVTDKYYKDFINREFDLEGDVAGQVFSGIRGGGIDEDVTKGKELVIFGEGVNPDLDESEGRDTFMYFREDVADIPDRAKACICVAIGADIYEKEATGSADYYFEDYDGQIAQNPKVCMLRVMFYSDTIRRENDFVQEDCYGMPYCRVNPLHATDEEGNVYEFGNTSISTTPKKVGGLYLRDAILPQVTSPCIYKNRMWAGTVKGDRIVATAWDSGYNFFSFNNTAADSVEIYVGSEGAFTGLKEYNDSLLCFKENRTIVVYGDTSYNFAIGKEIENIGCIDIRSCVAVDGVLYFCSKEGFYSYSGGWPQYISSELDTRYESCIAFGQDGKYYAEGTKKDGTKELVVYDTRRGIWLIEKAQGISGICAVGSDIYIATDSDGIKRKRPSGDYEENDETWFFESGDLYEGIFEHKGILEITLRAKIKDGCCVKVSVIDGDGNEEEQGECYGSGKLRTYRVPVRLKKGEAYRYKISGDGPCMIYDIERKVTAGGRTIGE